MDFTFPGQSLLRRGGVSLQLSWAYNDGREMHKDVFAAVFRRYETYALGVVEPLDHPFDTDHYRLRVRAGSVSGSERCSVGHFRSVWRRK